MSISVSCETCGVSYRVDDSAAGKSGRCKQCGGTIRVPAAPGTAMGMPPPLPIGVAPSSVAPPPQIVPIAAQPMGYPPPGYGYGGGMPQSPQMMSGSAKSNWKLIVGVVAAVLVVVGGVIWVIATAVSAVRVAANNAMNKAITAAGSVSTVSPSMFPARPGFRTLEPGVQFAEVKAGFGATAGMKLWIYLPGDSSTRHNPASLPCVFIAPAGSNMMTGMDLTNDDRPEHLPYVKAGFAVVAYALDGWVPDRDNATDAEVGTAMRLFMASDGGVANGKKAIDYATAKIPEIDPSRLFTAGHSSAGTVSLLMAGQDGRLRAAVAYAPCMDIEKFHGKTVIADIDKDMPGLTQFVRRTSPGKAIPPLCPVFLFHADDDQTTPIADSRAFVAQYKQITLSTVPTGGHADAMMDVGIGRAIGWLKQNGANPWDRSRVAMPIPATRPRPQSPSPKPSIENTPIQRPAAVVAPPVTRPVQRSVELPEPAAAPPAALGELRADAAAAASLVRTAKFGPFTVSLPDSPTTPVRDVSLTNGRATLPVFVPKSQLTVIFQIEPRIDRDVDKPNLSITSAPPAGTQKIWSPRATSGGYGTINGRTFARVERMLGTSRTQVQYAGFVDGHYVTIQITYPSQNVDAGVMGEALARSLR